MPDRGGVAALAPDVLGWAVPALDPPDVIGWRIPVDEPPEVLDWAVPVGEPLVASRVPGVVRVCAAGLPCVRWCLCPAARSDTGAARAAIVTATCTELKRILTLLEGTFAATGIFPATA